MGLGRQRHRRYHTPSDATGGAYEALLLNLVGTMEVFVMTKNLLTLLIAKALMREALSAASRRFESIQQLIDALARRRFLTCRRKRIQAKQGMLQNEATKLGVLYRARRPKSERASSAYASRSLPQLVLSVPFLRWGFDMTN